MRNRTRLGAALLGVSVALMLSALPANAAGEEWTIDLGHDGKGVVAGDSVYLEGSTDSIRTGLKGLTLGNAALTTYCIQVDTLIPPKPEDRPKMVEVAWDAFPDASSPFRTNNAKINWVLHNSYPTVGDLTALTNSVNASGGAVKVDGTLNEKEAIAGTQAAIWYFSDNKKLAVHNSQNVVALYQFLIDVKINVGLAQPAASLEIAPNKLAGEIGKKVGPFKITTTADKITKLTSKLPAGVTLTDKAGKTLEAAAISNGSEVFVSVPGNATAGEGSFTVEALVPVLTGRVFVSAGVKSQSLIVAASKSVSVAASANATASWAAAAHPAPAPAPQASSGGGLADTGVSIYVPIALGVLLLAAGAGALLFLRRRSRA